MYARIITVGHWLALMPYTSVSPVIDTPSSNTIIRCNWSIINLEAYLKDDGNKRSKQG